VTLFRAGSLTDKRSRRHLEFFPNPQVLLQTYSSKDPKLILAVPASFSHGPSRLLFADFAAVPDNVILLTGRGEEGTLGRILFERWNNSQRAEDKWDKGKLGSSVMLDGSLELRVGHWFHPASCPVTLTYFMYS
jgi:cleavage and polyadenylation specificity factor subunit 2